MLKGHQQFECTKAEVMQKILENKCIQVPVFQKKLHTPKQSKMFVKATLSDE